jgi:uncharacterized membrane protein YqjE
MATYDPEIRSETATQARPAAGDQQRGLVDLARVALEDLIRLVQLQIQLAKLELKELVIRNALALGLFLGAGFCLFVAFLMGLVTLALAFHNHQLLAAGVIAALFFVFCIGLGLSGLRFLKIGPPEKTLTSLKEDAEWARQVLKRNTK